MLLRRITQHVTAQNWFAVILDFIIVVIGVGVAMIGQQWLSERAQRLNTIQAEKVLQIDLFSNYRAAKERVSLKDCRIKAYQSLSEKLLETSEQWIGMPREDKQEYSEMALPNLLRSPSRNWGSISWQAELNRGTFNSMDVSRRDRIDGTFEQARHAQKLQEDIFALQGRMKTLAFTTTISHSDRLRYLDMLGELDNNSFLLELISGQIVESIEVIGIKLTAEMRTQAIEGLTLFNERAKTIYGDCREVINFSAINVPEQQVNTP